MSRLRPRPPTPTCGCICWPTLRRCVRSCARGSSPTDATRYRQSIAAEIVIDRSALISIFVNRLLKFRLIFRVSVDQVLGLDWERHCSEVANLASGLGDRANIGSKCLRSLFASLSFEGDRGGAPLASSNCDLKLMAEKIFGHVHRTERNRSGAVSRQVVDPTNPC